MFTNGPLPQHTVHHSVSIDWLSDFALAEYGVSQPVMPAVAMPKSLRLCRRQSTCPMPSQRRFHLATPQRKA